MNLRKNMDIIFEKTLNNYGAIGEDDEGNATTAQASQGVTVIDLVDAHRLKEIELDKKGWTQYIKGNYIEQHCFEKSFSLYLCIYYRVCQENQGKA